MTVDEIAARELYLYIDNDADLYRQQHTPIIKNYVRRKKKGTYDHTLAIKGMFNLATNGAKKYAQDFGGQWNEQFDVPTRMRTAELLTEEFETEYESGNYDDMS